MLIAERRDVSPFFFLNSSIDNSYRAKRQANKKNITSYFDDKKMMS